MPINQKKSARIFFPENNYKVARYLDLAKFLSLLQTEKIFFNKLSNFEDKFEGSINKKTYDNFENRILKNYEGSTIDKNVHNQIKNSRKNIEFIIEANRNSTCVSCWNKYNSESYALWKIYSNINQGIMIKTDINRLISAFSNAEQIIDLSEIKYLDYNTDLLNMHDLIFPIIHKNKPYSYEEEIRLFFTCDYQPGKGLDYDWSQEENIHGKYIKIEVNELIEEIVISPFSPEWFYDSVKSLVEKYGLNKNVTYSEFK